MFTLTFMYSMLVYCSTHFHNFANKGCSFQCYNVLRNFRALLCNFGEVLRPKHKAPEAMATAGMKRPAAPPGAKEPELRAADGHRLTLVQLSSVRFLVLRRRKPALARLSWTHPLCPTPPHRQSRRPRRPPRRRPQQRSRRRLI